MAEVGRRLAKGLCRLSVVIIAPGRPGGTGGSPGPLLISRSFSNNRTKEESTQDRHEVQPLTESRAKQRQSSKCCRGRTSESQQESGPLRCAILMDFDSSYFIEGVCNASMRLSGGLQPVPRNKLLSGRMSSWVSFQPETRRASRQLRSFSTATCILATPGSERSRSSMALKRLTCNSGGLPTYSKSRCYSSKRDSSTKRVRPLYRSRTAYYDILKVSPGATQSQIKTAYFNQSFIHHPDKNPGNDQSAQLFSEISEAYTVLGNNSLRRKYDRGLLSQSDVQRAGRPSSKETAGGSTGSPQQQHHRSRRFSQPRGKTLFDFDAFYQGHYGEQLRREQELRARKKHIEEQQKKKLSVWKQQKLMEATVVAVLTVAGLLLVSLGRP